MDKEPKKEKDNQLPSPSLKSEISRLSSGIKKANEMYDQAIAGINAWKAEKNKEINEMEKQIEIRFGGTVIDEDTLKLQKEAELYEQQVQEQIKKEQEELEALTRETNCLLGDDASKNL
jgi:predicted secreted Zn-dependent protease